MGQISDMNWLNQFIKKSGKGTIVAYHATTAGTKILQEGFKTRKQLSGRSALGGGADNTVSFTTDWTVAKGVFDGLVFAYQIANAPNELDFIKQNFYSLSPEIQQNVIKSLTSTAGGAVEKNIDLFFSGWTIDGVFRFSNSKKPLSQEELDSLGYKPIDGGSSETEGEQPIRHYSWIRPMDEKEKLDFLYSYLKAYHHGSGVYDPVFFGTDIQNFKGVNRQDIGIISAELQIDPSVRGIDDFPREGQNFSHRYVDSMAEIRVIDMNTITKILDFDINPGKRPKFTGQKHYYGEKEHLETAVNSLLDFIYKNYYYLNKFLEKHGLSAGETIASLQRYGEDTRKLWSAVKIIEDRSNLNPLNYVMHILSDYSRFKKGTEISPEVQKLLNILPENYKIKILNGEKASDVLYDMYEKDKLGYDKWWTSHADSDTAYSAEKLLDDFTFGRERNIRSYNTYGKQHEQEVQRICGNTPVEVVLGLTEELQKAKDNMAKQASNKTWMHKFCFRKE